MKTALLLSENFKQFHFNILKKKYQDDLKLFNKQLLKKQSNLYFKSINLVNKTIFPLFTLTKHKA